MIRDIYTEAFSSHIKSTKTLPNPIFVVLADIEVIDTSRLGAPLLDKDTFLSMDGERVFSKEWFGQIFIKLNMATAPVVLSYAQYSYVLNYLLPGFFKDRTIFLVDNLREIYPLCEADFITDTQEDDTSTEELPLYQADQFNLDGKYFYSPKAPDIEMGKIEPVFKAGVRLHTAPHADIDSQFIDPYSDWQSIDIFLSELLREQVEPKPLSVKFYPKQSVAPDMEHKLELLNAFLSKLGSGLRYIFEDTTREKFVPSRDLINLLHTYWGLTAEFRNIKVYKNPNAGSEVVEVSQGEVVQTLIDEYENVKRGDDFRDVFLTAPTGAGKSLLFQLPAFYIASKGDVTIVISPLIALMKDQVNAIRNDRKFNKVAFINSEVSLMDREQIIDKCKSGLVDILYMAPELLMSYDVRYFIGERHIGLMVIDEAHLITTWGRDFRVDYWYIGNHINKIRKYSEQKFPMIAVTATAVYGGDKNDMVFDTVDSLFMHAPHYYIGNVRRDDINFLISNYKAEGVKFDDKKLEQTASCVTKINELGFKSLVYAPYTVQVKKLLPVLNKDKEIADCYYGTLDAVSKEQAEQSFRLNRKRLMVCTKAFGMGVDISDIQVIYHHAPSGLLPDYVQEIGRAARKDGMQGYAVLNYSTKDQKYSNQLFGVSSLKLYQLSAVLKKIYDTYRNNGCKRNMLMSVDDFAFAFGDADDVETKVKTALMMIEKDYLAKYRYNVVLARPKQLFTKVYSQLSNEDYKKICVLYPGCVELVNVRADNSKIVVLDLNKLWSEYMSTISFPIVKRKYYMGRLLSEYGISIEPKLKLSYRVNDVLLMKDTLRTALKVVMDFFKKEEGRFFDKDALIRDLKSVYDDRTSRQMANFIMSSYTSEQASVYGIIEEDAFLQSRHNSGKTTYRIFGTRYEGSFASILKLLEKLFDKDNNYACRYLSKDNALKYIRIGNLMEILNVGSFEMQGGEAPMIFIRLNNPAKVEYDSRSKSYKNIILDKTHEKHKVSTEIMEWFFTRQFTNQQRWDFIEDFFLGENNEELFRKYPGSGEIPTFDVTSVLAEVKAYVSDEKDQKASTVKSLEYPPRAGKYLPKDHLTIEVNGENVTKTISDWIEDAPLSLYPLISKKVIYVDSALVYKRLMHRIEDNFPEAYNKILGMHRIINFPGVKDPIAAAAAAALNPVKFYRWWCKNRTAVYIPIGDKVKLFDKVYSMNPDALLGQDKKLIRR